MSSETSAPPWTIATWLIELRRRRDWAQQDAADHLGKNQQDINRWEKGHTPLIHYQRILNLLGAEVKMPPFPFTDPYATRRGQAHY